MRAARGAGGPFVLLKDYCAATTAIALWVVNILAATAWQHDVSDHQDRLIGGVAVTVSVWALLRYYRSPRPGSDRIVMSGGDYLQMVETLDAAAKARVARKHDDDGGRARRPA